MKTPPELSKAEFSVLKILWKHKALSVRELHDKLSDECEWAYTTTKTVMDRMTNKQLLARKNVHGVFVYKATISRPFGIARFIHFFAGKVLETDYEQVANMFAGSQAISKKELGELKTLLKTLEKENKK